MISIDIFIGVLPLARMGFIGLNVWLGWPVQENSNVVGMLGVLVIGVVLVVTGLYVIRKEKRGRK